MPKFIYPLIVLICISSALAVGTSYWTQTSEADFKAGTLDNVLATNLGDLKLSRATQTLLTQDARVSAVYALAEGSDGAIYAATGPQGVLLRIKDDKVETAATLGDNVNLFSLLKDDKGRLLIGTGGATGSIYRIDKPGDKPTEIFSDDDVQYIWSMVATSDGNIYAATGPTGKLFEIHPDGSNKIVFKSDENNLLSMVSDGKDLLYVGTDPNGHIYRINRKTGDSFIVYDAQETEVSALALDARGNLYAGTAQSTGEKPPEPEEPAVENGGRPEQNQGGVAPIPSEPPKVPEPPKLPLPGPGDPPAIPKKLSIQPAEERQEEPVPIPGPRKPRKQPIIGAAPANEANPQPPVSAEKAGQPAEGGNAVYKIDPDGFVTEIFRQDVLVLSIYEDNGVLLVGTGGEGMIYEINPAADETSIIARCDPKEVLCLLPTKDGKIYMGLANDGQVMSMSSGYATHGTFTSPVLDALQVSRFGNIHLRGTLPKDTSLTLATRSGNVSATNDPGWSKWSDEKPATEYSAINSPSARFLQYRLTFQSKSGADTPVVDDITVSYEMPNLAPEVKSIKVASGADSDATALTPPKSPAHADSSDTHGAANSTITLNWQAIDPNNDALQYTLYFRRADLSGSPWVLLKDKLTDATFDWNTRSVGDGRYLVKVVASDALANPLNEGKSASRVSDAIEVDNTPPVIGDLDVRPQDQAAKISARVVDRTSTVAKLEYVVDSGTDWQTVLPVDKIADSPDESYAFVIGALSAGPHQITLRASDAHGNQSFQSVNVTIK